MSTAASAPSIWVKSSYSDGNGGACVEWAPGRAAVSGVVPVRDSKDQQGPALLFEAEAWSAFVAGVRAGDFGA